MALFSYVVARDYGFAPNPFHGVCTLATCKPGIRRYAQINDWVVGTGSARHGLSGCLVFAMKVAVRLTFDEYWHDARFIRKRPNMHASNKRAFGDNIYHHVGEGWHQADSHHSYADGSPNPRNIEHDTKADRVLIASEFAYFGASGPRIPSVLRDFQGCDLCAVRGYKRQFPGGLEAAFVGWLGALGTHGVLGRPADWK